MRYRQICAIFFSTLVALQSWAAVAVPCGMPMDNGNPSMAAMDHHAGHDMMTAASDAVSIDVPDTQCCDAGYCSQSGCVAMSFLITGPALVGDLQHDHFPWQSSSELPVWSPNSLFRPPSS